MSKLFLFLTFDTFYIIMFFGGIKMVEIIEVTADKR